MPGSFRRPLLYAVPVLAALAGFLVWRAAAPPPAPPASAAPPAALAVADGRVDVEGGLVTLARDDAPGTVESVAVTAGAAVRRGQVLATLSSRQQELQAAVAQAEWRQAEAALAPLQAQRRAAAALAARLAPVVAQRAAPSGELLRARAEEQADAARLGAARAAVQTAHARWRLAQHEVERRTVRAPADGRILRVLARPGAAAGGPLFLFAPARPYVVRADLDERYLGQVQPGMRAWVSPEADPSRRYAARVLRVADLIGPASDLPGVPARRSDDRIVECTLRLDSTALVIGQRVLVRIEQ